MVREFHSTVSNLGQDVLFSGGLLRESSCRVMAYRLRFSTTGGVFHESSLLERQERCPCRNRARPFLRPSGRRPFRLFAPCSARRRPSGVRAGAVRGQSDLRAFKAVAETGEKPTTIGQPSGRWPKRIGKRRRDPESAARQDLISHSSSSSSEATQWKAQ